MDPDLSYLDRLPPELITEISKNLDYETNKQLELAYPQYYNIFNNNIYKDILLYITNNNIRKNKKRLHLLKYDPAIDYYVVRKIIDSENKTISPANKNIILRTAVRNNNLEMVNLMLNNNVIENDDIDDNILRIAIRNNNLKITEILLNQTKDRFLDYFRLLTSAIDNNNLKIIKLILNKKNKYGHSLNDYDVLFEAVENGNYDVLQLLLENGINIKNDNNEENDKCDYKQKILPLAVISGNIDNVDLLLEYGANVNICDELPLRIAIENNDLDMVVFLLKNGAEIKNNLKNKNIGDKIIIMALKNKSLKKLKLFLSKGAVPSIDNKYIKTILELAFDKNKISLDLKVIINFYLNDLISNNTIYKNETIEEYLTLRLQLLSLSKETIIHYLLHTIDNISSGKNVKETLNDIYDIDIDSIYFSKIHTKNVFKSLKNILNREEIKILTKYATPYYRKLNKNIRDNIDDDRTKIFYNNMMNIFDKVPPLNINMRVFRAIRPFANITYENLEPGFTFTENSFTSTTLKCCSEYFMEKSNDTFLLTFIIPSGFPAIPMRDVGNDEEFEILIPPGIVWKVITKDKIKGNNAVYLEIIDYVENTY